jgi:hypothetical protein
VLVQLFLTLISLPILIGWGLPLSLMAPLGNLLFSPILGLYLVCAMFLFFTELFGIPNSFCVWALETVSAFWLWCLGVLERSVQIGFARPHFLFLCIIPILACIIIWYCRKRLNHRCIAWLSGLLASVCFALHTTQSTTKHFTVARGKTELTCTIADGHVALIDSEGVLSHSTSADEWVIYHLIPAITAQTAATQIDHCMIVHPRQRTFEAITALCSRMRIGHVYIPRWEGRLKFSAWRAYCLMRDALKETGGCLTICNKALEITLSETSTLCYAPTGKQGKYHDSTYPIFGSEAA